METGGLFFRFYSTCKYNTHSMNAFIDLTLKKSFYHIVNYRVY